MVTLTTDTVHNQHDNGPKNSSKRTRLLIPASCYKKSIFLAVIWLVLDLTVYLSGLLLVGLMHSMLLRIAGGLLASAGVCMLYVWAHDAAHKALFSSEKVSKFWGSIAMLPAFSMCRSWIYGHNKVHHGFTSLTTMDSVWRPLSPTEFQNLSNMQRFLYRFYRSLPCCGLYYLHRIWWRNMVCYTPRDRNGKAYYISEKAIVLTFLVFMLGITYMLCGGISGMILGSIVPFLVFNYFIGLIVFLQHTHPKIPFFYNKAGWSHHTAAIKCSTIIHCSKFSTLLLHNILLHTAHHLDTRIPFYHLRKANQVLCEHHAEDIVQYNFSWKKVCKMFFDCQLYDYSTHTWHNRKAYK